MHNIGKKTEWTQTGRDLAVLAMLHAYSKAKKQDSSVGPESFGELWVRDNICGCDACNMYRNELVKEFIQALSDKAHA